MWTIPFGFAVVPAGVDEEEQVLGVHRLGRARRVVVTVASSCHQWSRPSVIGTSLPVRRRTSTLLHARRGRDRLVGDVLERHGRAAAPRLVLGDEHLAAHVVHPVGERVGREAAEDDGVRRAEARAREHRDRGLGDHAEVDPDGRALLDAELLERVREPDDLALQVGVGDRAPVADGLALPVEGDPVAAPRLDVPVDAVVGDVELAAEVPLRVRRLPLVELVNGSNQVMRSRPSRSQNASKPSS